MKGSGEKLNTKEPWKLNKCEVSLKKIITILGIKIVIFQRRCRIKKEIGIWPGKEYWNESLRGKLNG